MTGTMLELDTVTSGYRRITVVTGISMTVRAGTLVSIVGSNGAGKSTLLKTISGLLRMQSGRIVFEGAEITNAAPDRIVKRGLVHVAEGRRLFRQQSVADNLDLGLYGLAVTRVQQKERLAEVLEVLPALADRLRQPAGVLSGGQQQMLAIGQALIAKPRLLMLDEPSLGLAPDIVTSLFELFTRLRSKGMTIVLVEQEVERAIEISDYVYVLQTGRLAGEGSPADVRAGDLLTRAYLGAAASGEAAVTEARSLAAREASVVPPGTTERSNSTNGETKGTP
jgi:branched-chain amino acid transport system ATP-binding protein